MTCSAPMKSGCRLSSTRSLPRNGPARHRRIRTEAKVPSNAQERFDGGSKGVARHCRANHPTRRSRTGLGHAHLRPQSSTANPRRRKPRRRKAGDRLHGTDTHTVPVRPARTFHCSAHDAQRAALAPARRPHYRWAGRTAIVSPWSRPHRGRDYDTTRPTDILDPTIYSPTAVSTSRRSSSRTASSVGVTCRRCG